MSATILSTLSLSLDQSTVDWQQLLSDVIEDFRCTSGTLHFLDRRRAFLRLAAHRGIPDSLLPKIAEIPVGKGMAGIAAERLEPVELCNLQKDSSGVARPSAKETKVEGSIAVPILLKEELFGVLGIAKAVPHTFTEAQIRTLKKVGEKIALYLRSHSAQPPQAENL